MTNNLTKIANRKHILDINLENSPLNRAIFKQIFDQYFTAIVNFLYRYVNDYELAREIAQKTFVNIWNRRESIKEIKAVKGYLFTTAKNNALDHIRSNKKNEAKGEAYVHMVSEEESFKEEDAQVFRSQLQIALKALKPKNKEIFILNKMEGLSYQEIADHLDISKRAVEDNIARSLRILKDELLKTGDY